jgi:acyl-CoA synthetase (AMP-forming)/AMP-acid ligase II
MPADEWESLTLNYTSGTTGNPKGVVYSHRGAALMCYANVAGGEHGQASGLPVDAADVPLQRLVLSLDAVGGGRHARLPEMGAAEGDV